ncbi:MAG: MATE family efflux transporter [Proteobacteria bacterium]|nr:MATE family efflux transporter [Pseudomonadota bacterium]
MTDSRSIARQLWDLALPVIGLNVLNVLALAVDTAMCGRLPDAEVALAGLGFATQIIFLLMVAMLGLTVGTIAIVSRAHGAGEHERVEHVMRQSIQLTVVVAACVAVVGNLVAGPVVSLLGAQGPELEAAVSYLRPLLTGTVFYYLMILFAGVLRGVGNTKLPFRIVVVVNLINFGLNYGLILGNYGLPQMGVQGAAIGTLIAYAAGAVTYFVVLRRGAVPGMRPRLSPASIDHPLTRDLFRIGWPAALDMVILNAAFLSIIGMLGRVGPEAVAAHGVGLRIQALAFVPGMSISQATAAMVGQSLGAGNIDRANSTIKASIFMCTGVMTVLCLTIVASAWPITTIFDLDPNGEVARLSVMWMTILGLGMPIVGPWIAFVGMLQGSGFTMWSLRINGIATLLQIPLSFVLGFTLGLGPAGIWVAFPLSFVLKAALGYVVWKRQNWAKTGENV